MYIKCSKNGTNENIVVADSMAWCQEYLSTEYDSFEDISYKYTPEWISLQPPSPDDETDISE